MKLVVVGCFNLISIKNTCTLFDHIVAKPQPWIWQTMKIKTEPLVGLLLMMLPLLWNQRRKKAIYDDMVCVQQWNVFMVWVSLSRFWAEILFMALTQKETQYPHTRGMYWVWAENQSFSNNNNYRPVRRGEVSSQAEKRENNLVLSHWHHRCRRHHHSHRGVAFSFFLFVSFHVHRLSPIFHVIHRMFGFGFFVDFIGLNFFLAIFVLDMGACTLFPCCEKKVIRPKHCTLV